MTGPRGGHTLRTMYVLFVIVWLTTGQVGNVVAAGHGAEACEAAKAEVVAQLKRQDTEHHIRAIRATCAPLPEPAGDELVGDGI